MRLLLTCFGLIFLLGCRHTSPTPDAPTVAIKPCGCPFLHEPLPYSANQTPDSLTTYYLAIWKKKFLQRNQLSDSLFQAHIKSVSGVLQTWVQGVTFRVNYVYEREWLRLPYYETFQVKFDPVATASFAIKVPRGVFLTESQLPFNTLFAENDIPLRLNQPLAFSSCEAACSTLRQKTGYDILNPARVAVYLPGAAVRTNGDPYLFSFGTIDFNANKCVEARINLITGEVTASPTYCWIQ
ncbi:hypothetical protein [Fibrella arboris]|uniref:hypothetical protein n=1 Tax=Fibrella arboris TaxID=3242486 RepID=UPI0035204B64